MISVENVSKTFNGQAALTPTMLRVKAGTTTVLIGPSGCGKSTLLRLIAGLLSPDSGRITIDGVDITAERIDEMRHAIGYVIQDGGLFPHLNALDNVTLLARYLKRPANWIAERIEYLSALVNIPRDALARYPQQLSGGQRQRISLMRALMLDPPLMLLDEPLGALDPIVRAELQIELKTIFNELGKTVVFVTHDMNEAAYFADDIVLMRDGGIVQHGTFDDLLERPADPFVLEFIRAQRSILAERMAKVMRALIVCAGMIVMLSALAEETRDRIEAIYVANIHLPPLEGVRHGLPRIGDGVPRALLSAASDLSEYPLHLANVARCGKKMHPPVNFSKDSIL